MFHVVVYNGEDNWHYGHIGPQWVVAVGPAVHSLPRIELCSYTGVIDIEHIKILQALCIR
jgi:hypothetical protein